MSAETRNKSQTSSDHIRQLAQIDKDAVHLLRFAGEAVEALTSPQYKAAPDEENQTDFDEHRRAFTSAASQYFETLSSIDVGLRCQINALEAAGIIRGESALRETQNNTDTLQTRLGMEELDAAAIKPPGAPRNPVTGGLGNLDVGWLNSRNNNVGKEMEAEIWEEALGSVQRFEAQRKAGLENNHKPKGVHR